MPNETSTKKEKKDFKQEFLEMIHEKYGVSNAMVMDKALKTQDKQIEQAMMEGGMTADQIGQSKGINLGDLIKKSPNAFNQGGFNQQGQYTTPGWFADLFTPGGARGKEELKSMEILSKIQGQQQITPERQISTLTKTQDMLKNLGIKAQVGVTATGVPTLATQPELGLSELNPDQQVQAVALARKVAGVRGADRLIPSIVESLKSGKTIDKIEDELRLSGQSSEFTGSLRSAAQQVMAGKSSTEKQATFDDLDDLQGDPTQQMEYLKRMAIKNSPVDQQNLMMGKERTIEFLEEIENDLSILEKNGFPTGFFSGNWENLLAKVGQVQNPAMRKVATKIAIAVMQYRRSMTGVQFGMLENKEYKTIFPAIKKVGQFNTVSIGALKDTFKGDLDKFYSLSMGKNNYSKLRGESQGSKDSEILNKLGLDPNKFEIVK